MYCPSCGIKIKDEETCPVCGADLTAIQKMDEKNRKSIYYILIADFIVIGIMYYFFKEAAFFVGFIIIFGTLLIGFLSRKTSGNTSQIGKCCPNCYNMYLNGDHCIACGYHLDEILGFSTWTGYDFELYGEYFKISKYMLMRGERVYICTDNYPVKHMRNLKVRYKCAGWFSRLPCVEFDFDPQHIETDGKLKSKYTFKIAILKKLAPQIETVINDPLFENARSDDPYPLDKTPLQMDYVPKVLDKEKKV
jgi:hypothetical protein